MGGFNPNGGIGGGGAGTPDNTTENNYILKGDNELKDGTLTYDPIEERNESSIEFYAPTLTSDTGTFNLGGAMAISNSGENVTFSSYISEENFNPAWVKQGIGEKPFVRETPGPTPVTINYETSKADILVDPTWELIIPSDHRSIEYRFETDTTITNCTFEALRDGVVFYQAELDTMTADVEKVVDLTVLPNVPPDFFTGQTYDMSIVSPDGDVRLKGSTANALPYFVIKALLTVDNEMVTVATDSTEDMQFVIDEDDMASNSNTKVPTQQSVKKYVDDLVTAGITLKGEYNAATNTPDIETPAPGEVSKGDLYIVTTAGTFFTTAVSIGDALIANTDDPSVESDWIIMCRCLDAATIKILYESNSNTNAFTDLAQTTVGATSGTNTGDQDLGGLVTSTQVNNTTGYANYLDSSTDLSPRTYAIDTEQLLINDKAFPDGSRYPDGVTSYWDSTANKFTPDQADGNYAFTIDFTVDPDARDKRMIIKFISYDAGGPGVDVVLHGRLVRLQKDDNELTRVSLSFTVGITSAIVTNGVNVTLQFEETAADIYGITCGLAKVGADII